MCVTHRRRGRWDWLRVFMWEMKQLLVGEWGVVDPVSEHEKGYQWDKLQQNIYLV